MSKGNSPAFPCQDSNKNIYTGMNLRDYFALEALHALITKEGFDDYKGNAEYVAEQCYKLSNAMLDERQKYK